MQSGKKPVATKKTRGITIFPSAEAVLKHILINIFVGFPIDSEIAVFGKRQGEFK